MTHLAGTLEIEPRTLPSKGKVGMLTLIAAESAIFVIFVIAYLFYAGKSLSGPTTAILHPPIFFTVCLLSSSFTVHLAVVALRAGRQAPFLGWWVLTFVLGARGSPFAPTSSAPPTTRWWACTRSTSWWAWCSSVR